MSHSKGENAKSCAAATLNRREAMSTTAAIVGGATLIAGGFMSGAAKADAAKFSKEAAAYQDGPKGEQNCANCSLFVAPAACGVVEGTISSSGWCKLYQKSS